MDWANFLTSGQAPWWATGVFVILGSVVAAIASNGLAKRADKRKHRREVADRTHQEAEATKAKATALVAEFVGICTHYGGIFVIQRVRWIEAYPDWKQLRQNIGSPRQRKSRILWAELSVAPTEDLREMMSILTSLELMNLGAIKEAAYELQQACAALRPWVDDDESSAQVAELQMMMSVFSTVAASVIDQYPTPFEDANEIFKSLMEDIDRLRAIGESDDAIIARLRGQQKADELTHYIRQMHEHMRADGGGEVTFTLRFNEDGSLDIVGAGLLDDDEDSVSRDEDDPDTRPA